MAAGHGRAADERLGNDPTSELWGEHRSRYVFAAQWAVAGVRVLDVACGAGFGLQILRQAGATAIGFDLNWQALREAKRVDLSAAVVRSDGARLPLEDGSVDMVVSFETIEHVPDAAALVREFARVLQPNGRLVLSTPNRAFGPPTLHENNPYHVREFTGEELRALLAEHFAHGTLYGQYVDPHYRQVPFLMVERRNDPATVLWKLQTRLPLAARERLARLVSGRPFYPTESDYVFVPGEWRGAHALLSIAEGPKRR